MVEMAVVLAIISLMSWASFSAFETMDRRQQREQAQEELQSMQSALRAFALRHGRLPCPDANTTATGYENLSAGTCAAGSQLGWFPYISVGLDNPIDKQRARFAVYRQANATLAQDADLAVAKERTADGTGDGRRADVTDLIVALNNAAGATVSSSHPYLTGDGGAAGSINCTSNMVVTSAYWLVVPLEDRSGNASRLDAPHTLTGLCAASPTAPMTATFDDVVLSESPAQLAGWLRSSLP